MLPEIVQDNIRPSDPQRRLKFHLLGRSSCLETIHLKQTDAMTLKNEARIEVIDNPPYFRS